MNIERIMEEEHGWEAEFGDQGFGRLDQLLVGETINALGAWTYGSANYGEYTCIIMVVVGPVAHCTSFLST
jgi:hypothetical protein